jgi:hypothetical protein
MADTFAADPQEAGRVAGELTTIRSGLDGTANLFAGAEATASRRVQSALESFREDSSDSRERLIGLIEGATGLLRGLADGTTSLDQALSDSLEPEPQPAAAS